MVSQSLKIWRKMEDDSSLRRRSGSEESEDSNGQEFEQWKLEDHQKDILSLLDEDECFQINFLTQLRVAYNTYLEKEAEYTTSMRTTLDNLNKVNDEIREMAKKLEHQNIGESAIKRVTEIRSKQSLDIVDVELRREELITIKSQIATKEHQLRKMQEEILVTL